MKIAVYGDEELLEELMSSRSEHQWIHINKAASLPETEADAFFILCEDLPQEAHAITRPVFLGSMLHTLKELACGPNIIRFNAWPGFINKPLWEVAGPVSNTDKTIMEALGKEYLITSDIKGFTTPRVIAMIINEAFYALEADVSTQQEIDTAMKLGTNYPLGPFEWLEEIGGSKVLALLQELEKENIRYAPAPELTASFSA